IMVLRFDVTAREDARRAAQEAREAADAANQAKSEFLAGMSHELRTPLNAIIGFGQVLQRNERHQVTPAQLREYSDYIVTSGEHLLSLVNDVLDLASVEAGRIRVSRVTVAADQVVDRAIRTMRAPALDRSVSLQSTVGRDVVPIRADAHRLHQVLLNLVSNAIKYNRPDGAVTISAEMLDGCVRLAVTDTGSGVPADLAGQLFVPFQRLGAEFSAVEGTGIGLALSKRLVEAMDGRIGYRPEPGGGSTFWIDLPSAVARAEWSPAAGAPAPAASRATRGGYSVLYVEDNPLNLRLMEYLLETLPRVEMHSAPSGSIGIDLAVARRPDIVILDLNLPDMDGFQVLAALRARPETRDLPVIALTASAMPSDIQRGTEAGFRAYLTKPLKFDALLDAVDSALAPAPPERAA
ncbi:MAG TPA: ATP-binding protein, partial [Thalassobaculum sp.]